MLATIRNKHWQVDVEWRHAGVFIQVREKLGQFKHRQPRYLVLVLKLRPDSVFDRQLIDLPKYHIVDIQQ